MESVTPNCTSVSCSPINNTSLVNVDFTKVYVSVFYGFIAIAGILLMLTVFLSILVQFRLKMPPFFILLLNLNIADLLLFSRFLWYCIPCMLAESQVYGSAGAFLMGTVESCIFLTIFMTSFLISVNRSLSISAPRWCKTMFTPKSCIVFSCGTWLVGMLATYVNYLVSCVTLFYEKRFIYVTMCTNFQSALSFGSFIVYICAYCVAIFYIAAVWNLYLHRKRMVKQSNQQIADNMSIKQIRLFYQAAAIWLSLLGNVIGFRFMPLILTGIPAAMVGTMLAVGPSYVTWTCLLIFSQETRMTAAYLLRIKNREANSTPVVSM